MIKETKSTTLYDVIYEWWDDHFTFQKDATLHDLVSRIEEWLPNERVENKYDADYNAGWNDCLDTLKKELR